MLWGYPTVRWRAWLEINRNYAGRDLGLGKWWLVLLVLIVAAIGFVGPQSLLMQITGSHTRGSSNGAGYNPAKPSQSERFVARLAINLDYAQ
jgi:hypothetical protein